MTNKDASPYRLLTVSGAAKLLHVSNDYIHELLLDPDLPRIVTSKGQRIRIPMGELTRYLDKRGNNWFNY
ncbi:Hypothetical protein UCCLB556_1939 [Levilactobacillus brevis]|nr:Hypothetical protein UCCLB556_1939 [Levilactobacillus brevis]